MCYYCSMLHVAKFPRAEVGKQKNNTDSGLRGREAATGCTFGCVYRAPGALRCASIGPRGGGGASVGGTGLEGVTRRLGLQFLAVCK